MSKRDQFKNIKGRHDISDEPEERPYGGLSAELLGELAKVKDKTKKELATTIQTSNIRTGVFRWTSTGLEVEGEITRQDWEDTGHALKFMNSAIQFLIGDWVAYGEGLGYGDHKAFADQFGYEVNSLYNMKWVASNVEISLRRENLSFGHHKLVAGLKPNAQASWLKKADDKDWTVRELREALSDDKTPKLNLGDLVRNAENRIKRQADKYVESGLSKDVVAELYRRIADDIENT